MRLLVRLLDVFRFAVSNPKGREFKPEKRTPVRIEVDPRHSTNAWAASPSGK
jgi:hypothetical protein